MFDDKYYQRVMKDFNYDPLSFSKINFELGKLSSDDLQRKWLCHHDANIFAQEAQAGEKKCIVSTGFGLSGAPHLGTLSQILRSISLQQAGIPVNMVLGDLDAYNGKGINLERTLELAQKYYEFVKKIGFKEDDGSILRSQFQHDDVLKTSYLIGRFMDDAMFAQAEEDLHDFYSKKGKVDPEMSYRRKLSLNLMTGDFFHLHMNEGFDSVMVMLGIDEHKYVQFAKKTLERAKNEDSESRFNFHISGLYSPIIRGFNGYPKMSKSFPDSGINLEGSIDEIADKIRFQEGEFEIPENNVVYQMIASASRFSLAEIQDAYEACTTHSQKWRNVKELYIEDLTEIINMWRRI